MTEGSRVTLERELQRAQQRIAELEGELTAALDQQGHKEPADESPRALSSVAQYRELIENLHAGLVVHAADTSIMLCNATSAELLGLSMDQMTGKTAIDPAWCFMGADEAPMPLEDYPVNRVLATRQPLRNLVVGINRPLTEDRVWVLCNAYPVLDEAGELQQVVVTFIDISEQRRAESARERLEEQLRQTQRMEAVGQLAGGVAHDFNNLLTAIMGTCDLIELSAARGLDTSRYVEDIRVASTKAASLTRQLLAFSRKQVLQPRQLDLNHVVSEMDSLLRRIIGEDIEFVTALAEDLGPVLADPGQLEQVVMNLVVNARDALPGGGKVTLETAEVHLDDDYARDHPDIAPGPHALLSITDNGVGMTEEEQTRAFDPFFTTKEVGKGTGLGLATVYGVVKQSGGHIWLYSEPGEGTTFKIYLPVDHSDVEEPVVSPPAADTLVGTETVLVVEDEPSVRSLACAVLRRFGYRVFEAADPDEAVRTSHRIDGTLHLLLTDVVMPRASGRQLAKQLCVQRPDLRVLYMSGYTDNAIVHHGVLDRGAALLEKPFTAEGLALKVREVLDT
jgi:two-component system, cell cycle sensor histidine kinase and response regulator CckA